MPSKIEATTDRRKALKGADYVIIMIQVGGVDAFQVDYEIPMKYGVDQCIGDSMGPGGIFRALRTIPVLLDIARDMQELCPNAIMLNYANPMAACCWALGTVEGLKFVGLCHGVQTTMDLIAGYVGEKKEDIDYLCAGINHMAWFLKLEKDGRDLYPILREKFEKPEYYINEKVRGEVMRHFGYFMTESTGHLSEYVPWFRKNQEALDLYCDQPDFGGASGAYYHYCRMLAEKFMRDRSLEHRVQEARQAQRGVLLLHHRGFSRRTRYSASTATSAMTASSPTCRTAAASRYRSSWTRWACIRPWWGTCRRSARRLNMTNVIGQGLAAEAAITGNPELAMQAIALDPLTSAVLTLHQVREMVSEMFTAEAKWLPQFAGKTLAPKPTIAIPAGTVGVAVPTDPALAIANRFGKLANT